MAAKQGLTAHISQASEDARRAVLSRAPTAITAHSWLSNLNTTCTIKSAPPRTPEVMTLLALKSGWLIKRNEQQVWQRRWCCVVPHTFLYYFEAEPIKDEDDDGTREGFSGGGVYRSVAVENQDQLNAAVRDGCKGRSRNSTPLKGGDTSVMYNSPSGDKLLSEPLRGPTTTSGNLYPAGIIDLECYSCVNRSSRNELVFEVTGDEITNPDLRSFYFQAGSVDDCESWTNALLSDRHSALRDEREAYRQVCDSFQLQLQNLSDMIDDAETKTSEAEKQLYNVRSGAEKFRSLIVNIVREALEQKCWASVTNNGGNDKSNASENEKLEQHLEKSRLFFMDQIDEIISNENIGTTKNSGALIVQILADYLATVIGSYTEMGVSVKSMEQKLSQSAGVDKAAVTDLRLKVEKLEAERDQERANYQAKISSLVSQIKDTRNTNEELENQIQTQRVEFSMFQNQAKSKLKELSQHKKILKKEVIDLRKKIDEVGSERDAALHITDSHKVHAETEKEKNAMLEKYIERMENQVVVQQNMMEMISLSGMSQVEDGGYEEAGPVNSRNGSVVGRIIGAPDDGSLSSFGPRHYRTLPRDSVRDSVRDASPYRLPPRARVPSENAPASPVKRKRRDNLNLPMSPDAARTSSSNGRVSNSTKSDKQNQVEATPRRGTLDHEFMGNQNEDKHFDEGKIKKSSSKPSQSSLVHEDRVSRYQEALQKKNEKLNIHRANNDIADDDDKSNVSELTEDRTQRAFDSKILERNASIQYTMSDMTGENVINGIPEKTLMLTQSSSSQGQNNNHPPRYIIGAPQGSNNQQEEDFQPKKSSEPTTNGTKLSVAQRARLAAEQNSNQVNITAEAEAAVETLRLQEATERPQAQSSPQRTRSSSPGVFSSLASMMGRKTDAKSQCGDSVGAQSSEVTLTLGERQQQQRERQLRVLREQGLLRGGDDSITGGAGSQAVRSNSTQKSR